MRLDKFLCDAKAGSRSQVKTFIKQGVVSVNGMTVKRPEVHVNEDLDCVLIRGEKIKYSKFVYYMLHKPAGVVCAAKDAKDKTVSDLMEAFGYPELFSIGRLDKDTEGLVIMTNDGGLAHQLLSPKKRVEKVYYVSLRKKLEGGDIKCLEEGVDIGEKNITLPATVEMAGENSIYLTITEGKYHQVKRMLKALGNQVLYLRRLEIGGIRLDESLAAGAVRELTEEEVNLLRSQT